MVRHGACPGKNQNLAIWARKELKKADAPKDLSMSDKSCGKQGAARWLRWA